MARLGAEDYVIEGDEFLLLCGECFRHAAHVLTECQAVGVQQFRHLFLADLSFLPGVEHEITVFLRESLVKRDLACHSKLAGVDLVPKACSHASGAGLGQPFELLLPDDRRT